MKIHPPSITVFIHARAFLSYVTPLCLLLGLQDPQPSTTATTSPQQQQGNSTKHQSQHVSSCHVDFIYRLALSLFACLLTVNSQNHSAGVQTCTPAQPVHPATAGPVVLRTQPRFSWYQAFLAAGLLLGFGASAAVFIKVFLISECLQSFQHTNWGIFISMLEIVPS